MSKKNKPLRPQAPQNNQVFKQPGPINTTKNVIQNEIEYVKTGIEKFAIPLLLLVTLVAYIPVFNAELVSWDDPDYVLNNLAIRSLNRFGDILRTPIQGNYHPLTMFTLAINYAIGEFDPTSYHIFNLVFHAINVLLVYWFVKKLVPGQFWLSWITALLFAIHPLHVESVAWVAERKDVLYTLFFLWACIIYLKYLENKSAGNFIVCIVLFFLSLMSKPAAVIFPVVLVCIDLYKNRVFETKAIIEKIPFFIMALIFGYITYVAQSEKGAVGANTIPFPGHFKFFFGFYGLMMYLVKMIVPYNLCTFYPYTPINEPLPNMYYVGFVICMGLLFWFWRSLKNGQRLIAFGLAFYVANLVLVAQWLPVGSAIMADRYTYVPLIGIFLIIAYLTQKYAIKEGKITGLGYGISAIFILVFVPLTYLQSKTWTNSGTLWDQAIKASPSSRAYNNRAIVLKNDGDEPGAIEMYTKAVGMNRNESEAYTNRGNIYFGQNKDTLALADYRASFAIKPNDATLLSNLGGLYGRMGRLDSAMVFLNKSADMDSTIKGTFMNRGYVHNALKQFPEAIKNYNKYLEFEPQNASIFAEIGVCYSRMENHPKALEYFLKSLEIDPKSGQNMMNVAITYSALNNNAKKVEWAKKAQANGFANVPANFLK